MTEVELLQQYREVLHSKLAALYDQDVVPYEEVHYLVTELGQTLSDIWLIENMKKVA